MPPWIETEIKLGLPDEKAWTKVRDQLRPERVAHQTNHFFDTADHAFRRARIGLRLREADGAHTLTAKGPATDESRAVTDRIELESRIDPDAFAEALRGGLVLRPWIQKWRLEAQSQNVKSSRLQRFLDQLGGLASEGSLLPFGAFSNRREVGSLNLRLPGGSQQVQVELDRTEFPGGRVDFELEVELEVEREVERENAVASGTDSGSGDSRDGSIKETHRALIKWLREEVGVQPFVTESKLARLNAILKARD